MADQDLADDEVIVVEEGDIVIVEGGNPMNQAEQDEILAMQLANQEQQLQVAYLNFEDEEWKTEQKVTRILVNRLSRMIAAAKKTKALVIVNDKAECVILGSALNKREGFLLNNSKDPVSWEYLKMSIERIRKALKSKNLDTLRGSLNLLQDPTTRIRIDSVRKICVA